MSNIKSITATHMSAAILAAFFDGADAKAAATGVAKAEQCRMAFLKGSLEVSDFTTVREAIKDYNAAAVKMHGEKSAGLKSARNRTGEVKALYGALRFGGGWIDGGYHATVEDARIKLKAKGIKWDGSPVKEKWEMDIERSVAHDAQIEMEARKEVQRRENRGETLTSDQIENVHASAAEAAKRSTMQKLAVALVRKYGQEQAQYLIDGLDGAISAAQQEQANRAAEVSVQAQAA